jgi:hypothetical protein
MNRINFIAKLASWRNCLLGAVFLLPVGILLFAHLHKSTHSYFGEVPEQRQKINAFTATIKEESLDEAIQALVDPKYDSQYWSLGVNDGFFAQQCMQSMLSCRRATKVLQTVEGLSPKQRDAKCKEIFAKAFYLYTNSFDLIVKESASGTTNQSSYAIYGSRFTIALAMYLAADSANGAILEDQFLQLEHFKNRIRPFFDEIRKHPENLQCALEEQLCPDNCFQVNVLRLFAQRRGDSNRINEIEAACDNDKNAKMKKPYLLPVVPWNARTTAFDHVVGGPIDTTKGVVMLSLRDWASIEDPYRNPDQERLVDKLRAIAFRKP